MDVRTIDPAERPRLYFFLAAQLLERLQLPWYTSVVDLVGHVVPPGTEIEMLAAWVKREAADFPISGEDLEAQLNVKWEQELTYREHYPDEYEDSGKRRHPRPGRYQRGL